MEKFGQILMAGGCMLMLIPIILIFVIVIVALLWEMAPILGIILLGFVGAIVVGVAMGVVEANKQD